MNENEKKTNLFIYGSLRDPGIFKSVTSLGFSTKLSEPDEETLLAKPAFLASHRKVSPDNVYFYAVPNKTSRIEGFVVFDVPEWAMTEIDRYEGNRYERKAVQVSTAKGPIHAQAYLATRESMKKHFGDRFHVNLGHELWLRKRIEKFIQKHTRPGERSSDAKLERRAHRELLATTERDLVISHYRSDVVSDYYLEHELDRPIPSIKHLFDDPEAEPFVKNYLTFVVRQVLLNQLDEKIQSRYRFDIEHMQSSERYYKRSISLLAALQMINANKPIVDMVVEQALDTMQYKKYDLIDYVKYAAKASDSLFAPRVAQFYLQKVRTNLQPGLVPLGAEIELSNLGYRAVEPQKTAENAFDGAYDDFRYFHDFWLDILTWKLGGYIDDHSGAADRNRRLGFLEFAPGRLNITGELSRPATNDPWLLNQLIHQIIDFYDVKPHSLHLSFQLRRNQIGNQKVLPLGFVKCLLVLGGGLERRGNGKLWVSRMHFDEIKQYEYGEELVFTRTSKRKWYMGTDDIADKSPTQATTYVQQYKFIRLDEHTNYEPFILCLKGLQLAYNPADYLSVEQLRTNKKLRSEYEELKQWSGEPTQISPQTITKFIKTVQEGLMREFHHRPAHKLHYIDWALNAISVQLHIFNEQTQKAQHPSST